VESPNFARTRFNGFRRFVVSVPNLGLVVRRLTAHGIPFDELPDHIEIAADQCFGVRIAFERSIR
jgi:hypothetical protein